MLANMGSKMFMGQTRNALQVCCNFLKSQKKNFKTTFFCQIKKLNYLCNAFKENKTFITILVR
jgi:hypothetical protein